MKKRESRRMNGYNLRVNTVCLGTRKAKRFTGRENEGQFAWDLFMDCLAHVVIRLVGSLARFGSLFSVSKLDDLRRVDETML